jgi:hypothetical protein
MAKPDRRRRLLIVEDFGVGQSGGVVDRDVHVFPTDLQAPHAGSVGLALKVVTPTRAGDDAHVDGTVLHREVLELGFDRSYVTFVRQLRLLGLRPRCEACRTGGHGVTVALAHERGEEISLTGWS